jgi:hypothetical protein
MMFYTWSTPRRHPRGSQPRQENPVNSQNTYSLIVLGVLVVVGLGVAGYIGLNESQKAQTAAAFEARLTEYTSMPAPPSGSVRDGKALPRMITIDWKARKVDRIYFDLPKELRAETPDDVLTVVWLQWGEERVEEYEGGGWACRHLCTVTVFDKASKKVVAQESFIGGEPPRMTNTPAGSNDYGDKPTDKIVFFLNGITGR